MRVVSALALLSALLPAVLAASSSPSVNVELRASWNAAPFLLELIETAAQEDPSSYFPLLDLVAAGTFDNKYSDQELYEDFISASQKAGFLTKPEELSSFNFALAIHSAAPRIEAHYQFYETHLEPLMGKNYNENCTSWMQWTSKQFCTVNEAKASVFKRQMFPNDGTKLEFDRILGEELGLKDLDAIVYADLLSPEFKQLHKLATEELVGKKRATYRVRYKPQPRHIERPLRSVPLSGYGVELALKKTDYLVMDDRDVASGKTTAEQDILKAKKGLEAEGGEGDEEVADIKPLHPKDVAFLGIRAASFIVNSQDPFDSLIRMLEDFPKHSLAIANGETDEKLSEEIMNNRMYFEPGANSLMVNGMGLTASQINPFSLLSILRKERKLIAGFQNLGLTAQQAIKLLKHEIIAKTRQQEAPQRFEFRDTIEGGGAIVWLNDLENDPMYEGWSKSVDDMMDRLHPGQLPQIRKNFHHLVVPADLTNLEDISIVAEQLRTFLMRGIGMRYGVVPMTNSKEATDVAKIIYHLMDTYGIVAVFGYLDLVAQDQYKTANKAVFDKILTHLGESLKEGKTALTFEEVLKSPELNEHVTKGKNWSKRLGVTATDPVIFINGLVVQRGENWLREMSGRLQADVQVAQQAVVEEILKDDTDFVAILLTGGATRRNPHIFPSDEITIKAVDTGELVAESKAEFEKLPKVASSKTEHDETEIWVIGDFDEKDGYELLQAVSAAQLATPGSRLVLINNPEEVTQKPTLSTFVYQLQQVGFFSEPARLEKVLSEVQPAKKEYKHLEDLLEGLGSGFQPNAKEEGWNVPAHAEANTFWQSSRKLAEAAGFKPGQRGFVVNGRVIGPIAAADHFDGEDMKQLIEYERVRRIAPVVKALEKLEVLQNIRDGSIPHIANLITIANTAKAGGVFDPPPPIRISTDEWHGAKSMIARGDSANTVLEITALINPVSEAAQKWAPIIKVLSEMEGVYVKVYLSPPQMLEAAPIKRFYRYVLESKPRFDSNGALISPSASFSKLPAESLLTLGMDVPPSWLVTPKVSVHDLDNIKLSSMKEQLQGKDIYAQYELKSILVEGHSRDVTIGGVPKGAQLVLGTNADPAYADTIIMANLGYFQFKANPGYWKLSLKEGRSSEVFNLESVGTKGYAAQPGDDVPNFTVMSFEGRTLFPRLSRREGHEEDDVLAPATGKTFKEKVNAGLDYLEHMLAIKKMPVKEKVKPADINIFSVASGHLYERFLNIMMLSVMKHTDKTVKFWFIENFLSPSFKDFIPVMAKEYGFQYELVTYKWPHWLRQQKEKQREIWGYKILFLDVLFPLDLDKVIFVDADQIVRTDLKELVDLDLEGAPYGFTPMCDSREEIEGFRFWKQGYWKNFLAGKPYHISALYVVDLKAFRALAAGDRLRQHYHQLSADPNSLSNLDQDLPNHMQQFLPIHSLPQDWLWCETWCSDESLKAAKTIDLCNNPMTKEPKLDRARRQVPEWTAYDQEVAELARRTVQKGESDTVGHLSEIIEEAKSRAESSKKEKKTEEAVKKEEHVKDEL